MSTFFGMTIGVDFIRMRVRLGTIDRMLNISGNLSMALGSRWVLHVLHVLYSSRFLAQYSFIDLMLPVPFIILGHAPLGLRAIPFEILRGAEWKNRRPPPHILIFSPTTPTYFIFFADHPHIYFFPFRPPLRISNGIALKGHSPCSLIAHITGSILTQRSPSWCMSRPRVQFYPYI